MSHRLKCITQPANIITSVTNMGKRKKTRATLSEALMRKGVHQGGVQKARKTKYESAGMKGIMRKVGKSKAGRMRGKTLASLGRTEFFDHVKRSERTPAQQHTRNIAKHWSDLPNEILRQDDFPRTMKDNSEGQSVIVHVWDCDEWEMKILKALSSFATKTGKYCCDGQQAQLGKECEGFLRSAIESRREKGDVDKDSFEWGLTVEDICEAWAGMCEEYDLQVESL